MPVNPCAQPTPHVTAARDRREIIKLIQETLAGQALQDTQPERRAANAPARETECRARPTRQRRIGGSGRRSFCFRLPGAHTFDGAIDLREADFVNLFYLI